MADFPRPRLTALHEVAARILETRPQDSDDATLARDLLSGFHDVCLRWGLDGILAALDQSSGPIDLEDRQSLAESFQFRSTLAGKLGTKADFDRGGPRSALPRQLADCVIATLGLTVVDPPTDRAIPLDNDVRAGVSSALAAVLDEQLAAPRHRARVIAIARDLCAPGHHEAFDRLANELDDRGMKLLKQPKVPIVAVQAAQRAFSEARDQVMDRAGNAAIDRALPVLAKASTEAAARIDKPITHKLTPRQIAIARAADARIPRIPTAVVTSLLESFGELADLTWLAAVKVARPYAASQTFAVGELIEHPKFGQGTVVTSANKRIEVEFPGGKHTLVQAPK